MVPGLLFCLSQIDTEKDVAKQADSFGRPFSPMALKKTCLRVTE